MEQRIDRTSRGQYIGGQSWYREAIPRTKNVSSRSFPLLGSPGNATLPSGPHGSPYGGSDSDRNDLEKQAAPGDTHGLRRKLLRSLFFPRQCAPVKKGD
jgi:hypothetical protein